MNSNYPDERMVFVDLETAGLDPWRPIVQIAAIAVDCNLRELERFEAKIKFNNKFADPKSLCKASYSRELWKSEAQPSIQVMKQFSELLRRHATVDQLSSKGVTFSVSQLVAHNGAFDGGFLRAWYDRFDEFLPASPRVFCTLQRALWLFQEDKSLTPPPDFALRTLCHYFGVSLKAGEAHEALNDVRATVDLYRAISEHRQNVRQPLVACG
ncbi:DNA polymerase III PolC-type [Crateriforma conspicua]|uniref:DNA polymerase III PolC-type n=1 Tax=Crateriforma conspicua TaxID=2527996 RepID=A0A5C6FME0_9PLAN|nr:3'-5' exonuclease [Crateriforma conspicua]TWU62639.1 DNA polymerase III PolC-type [Crateriforma conspicua]